MVDVRMNFEGMYEDYSGDLCHKHIPQTQCHLTQCEAVIDRCNPLFDNIDIEYEDIYSTPEKQLKITKLYRSILQTRDKIVEESSLTND